MAFLSSQNVDVANRKSFTFEDSCADESDLRKILGYFPEMPRNAGNFPMTFAFDLGAI